MQNIQWENDDPVFFGKPVTTKRKVAWYDDSEYLYTYSSTTKRALGWTKELSELKQIVEKYAETKFNSCLLNLYHKEEYWNMHKNTLPEILDSYYMYGSGLFVRFR